MRIRNMGSPRKMMLPLMHRSFNMDLKAIGQQDIDWIHPAQDRDKWGALLKSVINFRAP
jgi:hypothetical protein